MHRLILLIFLLECSCEVNLSKINKIHKGTLISEIANGDKDVGDSEDEITASHCVNLITEVNIINHHLSQWRDDEGNLLMWLTEKVKSIKNLQLIFDYSIEIISNELDSKAMLDYLESSVNPVGRSLLFQAVVNKKDCVFNYLIDRGCTLFEQKDVNGDSPISIAILKGYEDMLEEMLKIRPDIINKVVMKGGYTLTCVAAMSGNLNIMKKLIKKDANLNLGGVHGHPLAIASMLGLSNIIEELLKVGSDVDIRYLDEQPMIWAASIGEVEIVELFLAAGARVSGRKTRKARQASKFISDLVARAADISAISVGVPGNAGVAKSIMDRLMSKVKKMSEAEKESARDVVKGIKDNYFWILKIDSIGNIVRYGSYYRDEIAKRTLEVSYKAGLDNSGNANRCFDAFTSN